MGVTTLSLYESVLQDNITPSALMACVKYSTKKSNYGQPHAFGKIKSLVRSHFLQTQKTTCWTHVMFWSSVLYKLLFFVKVKLNSCHATQMAISVLFQKYNESWELQSSPRALITITIKFVFQTKGRKSSEYPQTYKSKHLWLFPFSQLIVINTLSFLKKSHSNTCSLFERLTVFSFEAFFPGLYNVIIWVTSKFWIIFFTLAVGLYRELSLRIKVP